MNFIEVLKSVGGVKPCYTTDPEQSRLITCAMCGKPIGFDDHTVFRGNNGASYVCEQHADLDLAPLLAKPSVLQSCCYQLASMFVAAKLGNGDKPAAWESHTDLIVVGPQRASNLVYEIARQLGGTAVVAEQEYREETIEWDDARGDQTVYCKDGYNLSLSVPPDATVLFVTDRVHGVEMLEVERAAGDVNALPYLLALVSDRDIWKNEACKVIYLHQEKS